MLGQLPQPQAHLVNPTSTANDADENSPLSITTTTTTAQHPPTTTTITGNDSPSVVDVLNNNGADGQAVKLTFDNNNPPPQNLFNAMLSTNGSGGMPPLMMMTNDNSLQQQQQQTQHGEHADLRNGGCGGHHQLQLTSVISVASQVHEIQKEWQIFVLTLCLFYFIGTVD